MILPALASPLGLAPSAPPRVPGGESVGDFGGTLASLLTTTVSTDIASTEIAARQPVAACGKSLPDAATPAGALPFWSPPAVFPQAQAAAVVAPVATPAALPFAPPLAPTPSTVQPIPAVATTAPAVALGTSALTPVKSPLAASLVGGGDDVATQDPATVPVENRLPPTPERAIRIGLRGTERPTTPKRQPDSDATEDAQAEPDEDARTPAAPQLATPVAIAALPAVPSAVPQAARPELEIGTATLADDAITPPAMPAVRQAELRAMAPVPAPANASPRGAEIATPPTRAPGAGAPTAPDARIADETSSNGPSTVPNLPQQTSQPATASTASPTAPAAPPSPSVRPSAAPTPLSARTAFTAAPEFQVAAAILSATIPAPTPAMPVQAEAITQPAVVEDFSTAVIAETLPPLRPSGDRAPPVTLMLQQPPLAAAQLLPGTLAQDFTPAIAAGSPVTAEPLPPRWSSRDSAPTVTLVAQQPPAAAQPQPGTVASAAQVFGAAIQAAAQGRDEPRGQADAALLAPLAAAAPVHALAPTADAQAPLDMRQERWPSAMIERIDMVRDAANATDTRIRLIPDALGAIDVAVRRDGDTVHVHFTAEQAATRTLLQEAQPRLAELADARGLKLSQGTVDAGAGQQQQRAATPQQPPAPGRPRAATAMAADTDSTDTRLA